MNFNTHSLFIFHEKEIVMLSIVKRHFLSFFVVKMKNSINACKVPIKLQLKYDVL